MTKNKCYENSDVKQRIREQIAATLKSFHQATGEKIVGLTLPGETCKTEKTINRVVGEKNCSFEGYECNHKVFLAMKAHRPANLSVYRGQFPFLDTSGFNFIYADLCGFPTNVGRNAKADHGSDADQIASTIASMRRGVVAVTFCLDIRTRGGRTDSLRQMGVPEKHFSSFFSPSRYATIIAQYIVNKTHVIDENVRVFIDSLTVYQNGKNKDTYMTTIIFRVNHGAWHTFEDRDAPLIALEFPQSLRTRFSRKIAKALRRNTPNNILARFFLTSAQSISSIRVRRFRHGKFSQKQA